MSLCVKYLSGFLSTIIHTWTQGNTTIPPLATKSDATGQNTAPTRSYSVSTYVELNPGCLDKPLQRKCLHTRQPKSGTMGPNWWGGYCPPLNCEAVPRSGRTHQRSRYRYRYRYRETGQWPGAHDRLSTRGARDSEAPSLANRGRLNAGRRRTGRVRFASESGSESGSGSKSGSNSTAMLASSCSRAP